MIRILMLSTAALLLSACEQPAADESAFAEILWTVSEIDGAAPANAGAPSILFNGEGSVSGRGSCNSWGASYVVKGRSIDIKNIFATKMACPGPEGEEEAEFFDALEAVDEIAVESDALVLSISGKARIKARKE